MDFAALKDSESRPSSSPLPAEPEDEGKPKELDPQLLATPRGQKVKAAVDLWKSQLIDIGGRNNLLYYRDLTRGTLDLEQADPAAVRRLLEGKSSVALSRMFTDRADLEAAVRRARTISKKAREHFEERGIDTLSLACGMATWENTIGTATPAAPILLRGAQLVPRGAAQDDFDVVLSGEMDVNPTLLHFLESQFDCTFDLDALYARMDGAIDTPEELESAYAWMQEHGKRVPSFAVRSRLILGTFSYAKLPMVKDLENALGELIKHDVIAAIAGDGDAREALRGIAGTVGEQLSVADPNYVPLADEFLILDADSSQNYAINFVLHGGNLIVKGPPGTGKSQTISNLIASLVARGKRVLFVAEKRAAIDAVLKRLDGKGLGDLVLDLHGGRSRQEVAETLERALDLAGSTPLVDRTSELKKLEARRAELRDYADALHAEREPWGVSVFDAQAKLLGIEADVETDVRWRGEPLRRIDVATAEQASEDLRGYVGRGGLTLKTSPSPWAQAEIAASDEAGRALTLAQRLAQDVVPSTLARLETAAQETGLTPPSIVAGWRDALEMWREVAKIFDTFSPEVFSLELEQVTAALEPAATGGFARFRASLFSGAYKEARSTLRSLARTESISDGDLYASAVTALERRCFWDGAASTGALPTVPSALEDLAQAYFGMCQELDTLSKLVGPEELLAQRERDDLLRHLNALVGDRQTLYKIPELRRLEKSLDDIGLRDLVEGMRSRSLDEEECVRCFGHAWFSSILEDVQLADPRIGAFDGLHHSRLVEEYRTGDSRHIETTAQRIKRAYAEHAIAARNSFPAEAEKVRAQAKRRRGHRPTRTLFREAPNVLLALKPCWAMSPLLVSQTAPGAAALRRRHLRRGEPDTPGRRGAGDPSRRASSSSPATRSSCRRRASSSRRHRTRKKTRTRSCCSMAATSRASSRSSTRSARLAAGRGCSSGTTAASDERLIAFSNAPLLRPAPHHVPRRAPATSCMRPRPRAVPSRPRSAQEHSVSRRGRRVVELILEHARDATRRDPRRDRDGHQARQPDRRALCAAPSGTRPELEEFFSDDSEERFFVKNLERVQGDERDAIILSIGYGKTPDGRLLYRFGPLNRGRRAPAQRRRHPREAAA